jgi:hypothetical protein
MSAIADIFAESSLIKGFGNFPLYFNKISLRVFLFGERTRKRDRFALAKRAVNVHVSGYEQNTKLQRANTCSAVIVLF